jgi:small subunit ribosomal protein S7
VPRKGSPVRKPTLPDPKYGSVLVTQLTARIMRDGKRSLAEGIIYDALANIGNRTQGGDPISVLKRAVENVRPQVEVKSRRVGGATYQVPIEVRPARSTTLALRWLVGYARIRREHTMGERLAGELMDASNGVGAAVKRREDTHKMAEANRAFAHYRW